jgi:hypothetical protein
MKLGYSRVNQYFTVMYSNKTVFKLIKEMEEQAIRNKDKREISELSFNQVLKNYKHVFRRFNRTRLSTVPAYIPLERAA